MDNKDIRITQAKLYEAIVLDDKELEALFQKYSYLLDEEIVVVTSATCKCRMLLEGHSQSQEIDTLDSLVDGIHRGRCACSSGLVSGSHQASCRLVHAAAGFGNLKALYLLAKYGCSLNATTSVYGLTPLMNAVCGKDTHSSDVMDFLMSQNVDVNAADQGGLTSLMYAVMSRRTEMVKKLLTVKDINVNYQCKKQDTALMLSIRFNCKEEFDMLLASNANPELKNRRGICALFEAVRQGMPYIKGLLENGANVNVQNKRGDTLLLFAVQNDVRNLLDYLLKKGADPNLSSKDNPLLIIAAIVGSVESTKALIEYKADVNKTNLQGYNALHVAAWNGYTSIIEVLLKAGIPPDIQTGDKNTALALAAHGNFLNVVKILLPLGCNVNNKDKDNDTPIHYASYNDNVEIVKELLQHGADPGATSNLKVTPLWNAVYKRNKAMVKLLLSKNVDMEVESRGSNQHSNSDIAVAIYSEPHSVLYVAADRNSVDIALLLVSAGYNIYCEKWLLMGEFPPGAVENQSLCSLLTKFVSTPPRLLALCRNFLRGRFGSRVHDTVKILEIPSNLKNYLTLSDLLS